MIYVIVHKSLPGLAYSSKEAEPRYRDRDLAERHASLMAREFPGSEPQVVPL